MITFKKRNKFDFIAVSLVILGATIMICSFGNAERSTALPNYYWSIDKYFVAFYLMSKYSNVTAPTLVSSQVMVNFNIIFSTTMLILFCIFNLKMKDSKVLQTKKININTVSIVKNGKTTRVSFALQIYK